MVNFHGKPLVTHREIILPTHGIATRWGKIHTLFLLSGGMRPIPPNACLITLDTMNYRW